MPASRFRMPRSAARPCAWLALSIALGLISACATGGLAPPSAPDERVLAPAEQALAEARDAQADTFAPRSVDAARRRIATARDILYGAAKADRPLNDGEKARVDRLVAAARLDARSALVETQAKAVQTKLKELQAPPQAAPGGEDQSTGQALDQGVGQPANRPVDETGAQLDPSGGLTGGTP